MRILINADAVYSETEIAINCGNLTPEIKKIIALLWMMDMKLTGRRVSDWCGPWYILKLYAGSGCICFGWEV